MVTDNKNKVLNVPNLRFPEFTSQWERYGNDSLFSCVSEKNKSKSVTDILSASQTDGMVMRNSLGIDIKFEEDSIKTYKIVRSGDYVIHLRSFQGGFAFSERMGVCSPAYTILRPNTALKYGFLRPYFMSNKFINSLKLVTYGIRDGKSISVEDWLKLYTYIPEHREQEKISLFLSLLDERIATQIKIIEDLKKLKSAICNHYFKEGRTKLGDIGTFVRGLTYSSSDVIEAPLATVVLRSNNIINGESANLEDIIWVNKNPSFEQILKNGDIIMCMANGSSSLVGKTSYYASNTLRKATVGAFCGIYRSDNPIVKWFFQTRHYRNSIQKSIQGGNGAIANIYPEDILAISFEMPQNYKLVGNTLSSIEDKMLAEQKVLNCWQELKEYLLSQMFI